MNKNGENNPFYGKKHTQESKEKMRQAHLGMKHTKETKQKMSKTRKGKPRPPFSEEWKANIRRNHWMTGRTGEKHPRWKGGKRKSDGKRNDSLYQWWTYQVRQRDNNICQLKNDNCSGYNMIHHIKGWTEYPELRYKINNGITLCQTHHPRKRVEEKELMPLFEELIKQQVN